MKILIFHLRHFDAIGAGGSASSSTQTRPQRLVKSGRRPYHFLSAKSAIRVPNAEPIIISARKNRIWPEKNGWSELIFENLALSPMI